jgi:tetratricopeptide (TPR) repeat protein
MPSRTTIPSLLRRIREEPSDAELHQGLGRLYLKKGMTQLAKAAYERSLELDPCDPWTHLYLGNWYEFVQEYEQALECFAYAARLLPDDSTAFWCMAGAYESLGMVDLAAENYELALDTNPKDRIARKRWHAWQRRHAAES